MDRPLPPILILPHELANNLLLIPYEAENLNYQQNMSSFADELEISNAQLKLEIAEVQLQLKEAKELQTSPSLPDVEFIEYEARFIEESINKLRAKLTVTGQPVPRIDFAGTYDGKYYVCNKENFQKLVEWDWVNTKKWLEDRFDCDDFAFFFKANLAFSFGFNSVAIVIDRSSLHAYILVFLDTGPVVFEPQDDTFHEVGEALYKMQWCEILI